MGKIKTLQSRVATVDTTRTTTGLVDRDRGGRWRRKRERVFRRDDYLCVECKGRGEITACEECDHIVPLSQGGTDEMSNLQSLCKECHAVKTAGEAGGCTTG